MGSPVQAVRNAYISTGCQLSHFIGRHCCLYCEISSEAMKTPLRERGRSPCRTLESLQRDYLQFSTKGGGNIKNAKNYNNVISSAMFSIPVSQVCIMYYVYTCVLTLYIRCHASGCITWSPHILGDIHEVVAANGE